MMSMTYPIESTPSPRGIGAHVALAYATAASASHAARSPVASASRPAASLKHAASQPAVAAASPDEGRRPRSAHCGAQLAPTRSAGAGGQTVGAVSGDERLQRAVEAVPRRAGRGARARPRGRDGGAAPRPRVEVVRGGGVRQVVDDAAAARPQPLELRLREAGAEAVDGDVADAARRVDLEDPKVLLVDVGVGLRRRRVAARRLQPRVGVGAQLLAEARRPVVEC